MAVIHNEYLGWQIEFPIGLQTKLENLDEDARDELREYIHETFCGIDTFHSDCVTFDSGFESMEGARETDKAIQKAVRTWLKNYNARKGEAQ